jgi:CBS domain containing-hemolysin-like protein
VLQWLGIGDAPSIVIAGIIAFAIITVLHVIIGELAPKSLAVQKAEPTASALARPLEWFRVLFWPFIVSLNHGGNWVVRRLGVEPVSERELVSTPEDLQRLIAESEQGGTLDPIEADMLEGVFGLHETVARDIMTPRPEVVGLREDDTLRHALVTALDSRHSRFPVLGSDGVKGVVHFSGLARGLLEEDDTSRVRDVMSPTLFVPETMPIDDLLRELQRARSSLAVVLDEYGDLAGVVTVEDVIEEIVGEIHDERDRAPAVDRRPDGRVMVRGHVSLEDLHDHGIEMVDDSVTSVGGLVFSKLGRLPRTGDTVVHDGWDLTVEATRGTRVLLVGIAPRNNSGRGAVERQRRDEPAADRPKPEPTAGEPAHPDDRS